MSSDTAPPTIYAWAGGRDAFARWLGHFYDLVEADALLAPLFGGRVSTEHREHVTDWWAEVMGGPATYTAQHGGYEHMVAKHRGLAIDPGMAQPRLRGRDHTRRHPRALAPRELTDDGAQLRGDGGLRIALRACDRAPRQRCLVRREVDLAGEVDKRW